MCGEVHFIFNFHRDNKNIIPLLSYPPLGSQLLEMEARNEKLVFLLLSNTSSSSEDEIVYCNKFYNWGRTCFSLFSTSTDVCATNEEQGNSKLA